jgi:Do/DeqQ family serine protease
LKKLLPALLLLLPFQASAALAPSAAVVRAAEDFSRVAELADPWVVNISTTQIIRSRYPQFWSDFFDENFMNQGREYRRQSLGSGFILSADGQIVTNAHVVSGADEIKVRLVGGDEYTATVLGEDEGVDLAVIRIKPKAPLKAAILGDSSRVKVGEWAIAIGNPFGFDHSVTVGVISAKERGNVLGDDGRGRYQNFLQTDASINHGNSGGPLCNIQGEVIGINTAISTPNEGSIGIGFAIPINMVKRAVPDLVKSGHVVTPRLGFYTQDIDARLASALKLGSQKGVLVSDVVAGGPADKAGLKRYDVITAINGRSVAGGSDFKARIFEAKPGETLSLGVLRKGQKLELSLATSAVESSAGWHGLEVEENNADKARAQGLYISRGMLVSKVAKGSSAAEIGLKPGDVILEVNQQAVESRGQWNKVTSALEDDVNAVIRIVRGQQSAYVVLPAEE